MKFLASCLLVAISAQITMAQRPFYAGTKPIGYPELASRFESTAESTTLSASGLGNRVGEEDPNAPTTTTMRLPYDALGQKELIDRIKTWPKDKWPYWYLNYVAIEEHRARRPQGNQNQMGGVAQTGSQNVVSNTDRRPQTTTNTQRPQTLQPQPSNTQQWRVRPQNNQNWRQQEANQNW